MSTETRSVVIIGSGSAGYTAAIYSARADLKPLLFGGVATGGQLMLTSDVENFPGFPEPVLGPDLMDRMRKQCERLGVEMIAEDVAKVQFKKPPFELETTEGKKVKAQAVIIATGANAMWLDLPSEKKLYGKGVSACAVCDGFFFKGKEVCVVGGGDTAIEEATFLTKFATKVTLIHRRDKLRASKIMQERAFKNPKIKFIWDSIATEVLGTDSVTGIKIQNLKSLPAGRQVKSETIIPCQGFFVAIGHSPNTKVFQGQILLDPKGYIITDGRTHTSVPGIFAAGDVMDSVYRQAVTAAGTGCMAALEAEKYLAQHEH
ncbi:MAG: thioredoxin-disulfide reductase [Elusimicrobia bacterium]|nr:thioredoxin-disulfide reductase [Elusimicrobiota bacterium]